MKLLRLGGLMGIFSPVIKVISSYIVNLAYVKGVKKLEITLITGEKIPISQPRRKSFMEQLTDYWGDML